MSPTCLTQEEGDWLLLPPSAERDFASKNFSFNKQSVGRTDQKPTLSDTWVLTTQPPLLVNRGLASSPANNFEPLPGKTAEKYFEVVGTH